MTVHNEAGLIPAKFRQRRGGRVCSARQIRNFGVGLHAQGIGGFQRRRFR